MKIGDDEPSWPSTSTETGVIVMNVLGVAFAGIGIVAVNVMSLLDGTTAGATVVSSGVSQVVAPCMRKPSLATPTGWVARRVTVRPAAGVALSPATGARNRTLGPVAMRMI